MTISLIYFCVYLCMFAHMCQVMGVEIRGRDQIKVFGLGGMHLDPLSPLTTPLVTSLLIIILLDVGWCVELLDCLSHSLKKHFCIYHPCVSSVQHWGQIQRNFFPLKWRNKTVVNRKKPSYLSRLDLVDRVDKLANTVWYMLRSQCPSGNLEA